MAGSLQNWCAEWRYALDQSLPTCLADRHRTVLKAYWQKIWSGFADTDAITTISDIQRLGREMFFLPGNLVIYSVSHLSPWVHDFLEISEKSFGSTSAGVISAVVYGFAYILIKVRIDY